MDVERICKAHDEERPMRIELVDALRRAVPFSSYVWALVDPETEVPTAPLADVPEQNFARAHALSPRERELVELLVDGADTKTVADSLFLSAHTVQDHLKSIFAKTGARNRRTLLTRVTGR